MWLLYVSAGFAALAAGSACVLVLVLLTRGARVDSLKQTAAGRVVTQLRQKGWRLLLQAGLNSALAAFFYLGFRLFGER